MTEYIKKSDVMDLVHLLDNGWLTPRVDSLPVHIFPDAPKESSPRDMITAWQQKGHGLERLSVILYYIASKLEELEKR